MTVPLPYLLGLVLLLGHGEWAPRLPGEVGAASVLPWLVLVPLPAVLARTTLRSVRRRLHRGVVPLGTLTTGCRLQSMSVPLVAALLAAAGWGGFVEDHLTGSDLLTSLVLLGPLIVAEVGLRWSERSLRQLLAILRIDHAPALGSSRLAIPLFLTLPLLLLAGGSDLVALDRHLEVFVHGTALGMTLGLLVAVLLLCALLPLVFRWVFPVRRELPAHLREALHSTASRLGFTPDSVFSLDTGHRMINAALVGPLPWPRYLVLTDGLLSILDRDALRGVMAHEIGHARARHPAVLVLVFAVVPLLVLHPMTQLEVFHQGGLLAGTILALGLAGGVFVLLRGIAHRFEYEADLWSARALGSAVPCIRALQELGRLMAIDMNRASWRHPSERKRVGCMLRWEADPVFRETFERRGRWLRGLLLVLGLAGVVWSAVGHLRSWPVDRAVLALYTGDVAGARRALEGTGDGVPPAERERYREIRAELEAAADIAPEGGPWGEIAPRLASEGWRRGLALLESDGAGAAVPWLGLALVLPDSPPVRRCLYRYALARRDGMEAEAEELRAHLLDLDTGERVRRLLSTD